MINPLEKFLNFSSLAFWQKRGKSVIGLDIGASSVKVVQLRKEKGRVILETYGEIATGPYRGLAIGQAANLPIDKMGELLRDLFKEANITTTAGSMAIPLGSSLLLIIEIPKVSEQMLAKVIPIEARKYIPVPISEVALDWWVIPSQDFQEDKTKEAKMEALVVAIHNTIISQYQELARSVNLNTSFFEIETFSALRAVFSGDMAPTAILDMGAGSTKLVVVDYGIVRLSHTIPKGSQDITMAISRAFNLDFAKAEEIKRKVGLVEQFDGQDISVTVNSIIEYIFSETNKVITGYQQKHRRAVKKIMLIGGGSLLRGLVEVAGKNFEVPLVVGRPFEKTDAPAFLEGMLSEAGPGFAVAIGLALRHLQSLE